MRKNIRYYVAVVTIILIVSIAVVMRTDAGEKKIPDNVFKCYTTIEIKEGDTLWKLADRYSDPKYISRSDYVKEIKKINGLSGDTIHSGNYITVSYYISNNQDRQGI